MKEQFKPEAQGADADLKAQLEREYLRIVEQYRRLAGKEPLPSEYGRFRDQAFERVYGKKPQVEGKIEEAREALSGAPRESEQVAEHPEFKCPGCGEALELHENSTSGAKPIHESFYMCTNPGCSLSKDGVKYDPESFRQEKAA